LAGIDSDRDVILERLPARLHVARPQERGVTLHPRITVPMQRIDALIRPPHLLAFEIHPIASQARRGVEPIALIGPPAIDSQIEQ
jgi:hypothetical protein